MPVNPPDTVLDPGADALRGGRITRVETIPLRLPLRSAFEIATGGKRVHLDVLLVRLHSDSGATGVGESQAWRRMGSSETLRGLVNAVEEVLAPRVLGRSVFEAPGIMADLDRALWGSPYAKAAVADALLDLQARLLDVPAWCLLGGQARGVVDLSAVLPIDVDAGRVVDAAIRFHGRGFRSFVVKVGAGGGDAGLVGALRNALPDAALRLDANASLDFPAARALADSVANLGVEAIEQPLAPWDIDGMAALARATSVPLIADESVANPQDLLRVLASRAAHGVQTKVAKNGGAWRTRERWSIATAAGLRIYPGNHPSTSVAAASVAHLAAAWPGNLEPGPFAVGVVDELVQDVVVEPIVIQGAQVVVPKGPGFGVELDAKIVERHRLDR